MVEIVLENKELVQLLERYLPRQDKISEIKANGSKMTLKFKNPGILPSVSVDLEFAGYFNEKIIFNLEANPLVKRLIDILKPTHLEWLEIDSQQISININYLLEEKNAKLKVANILQAKNGKFLVDVELVH